MRRLLAVLIFLLFLNLQAGESLTPVLCLASKDTKIQGLDSIDPKALEAYREKGYDLHLAYYQDVTEKDLMQYKIVVGMITQLHRGTVPINTELAAALDKYLRRGGGFILIPAPSYYGAEDFVLRLNPVLEKYGCKLLSEIPLDPSSEKTLVRVLGYRYLKTTNLKKHPVTEGIKELWLPLDFANSYLRTHTMGISPEWESVVNGEITTVTYPFNKLSRNIKEPGTYRSEPPFLAVRQVGKGRLAVFTTASRYFIFDAYHWAHGGGFVMNNGGLKLMTNLFKYVSANAPEPQGKPQRKSLSEKVEISGNVPVCQDKKKWLEIAMDKFQPHGTKVKYYIDCGAQSDLPYTKLRGCGYLDIPYEHWLIRWAWSDIFHATAANSRAFDRKKVTYRFAELNPGAKYQIGLMVWAYQDEGARSLKVDMEGASTTLPLPRFKQGQGPRFTVLKIPEQAVRGGSLDVVFSCGKEGEGTFSSVCELWLYEAGKAPKLTAEELVSTFESPSAGTETLVRDFEYFNGLIGAKSNYSGGKNSVVEMAVAAQKCGYSFLVFNDELSKLDMAKYKKLLADCRRASGKDFTAIAGMTFTARNGSKDQPSERPQAMGEISAYVFTEPLTALPDGKSLADPYSLFWRFFGGELSGGKKNAPTLLHPGRNDISPFFQRFWRGIDVLNFDAAGKIYDDSEKLYRDLLASGYGPYPRVSGDYRSVSDIERAAATKAWQNTILAWNRDILPVFSYSSNISSGPKIKRCQYSFDYLVGGEVGGGILFRNAARMNLDLLVEHSSPITEISLYKSNHLIRRWYPNRQKVEMSESFLITGQREMLVEIRAADGTRALTGRFQAQDRQFLSGMCGDNQNSICSFTRPPSKFELDEREIYLQHSYWHTGQAAGQLGFLRDSRELVPRIIETGIIQPCKMVRPCPVLTFKDGRIEDHTYSEMRIVAAGRDYNLIRYSRDLPGDAFKTDTDIVSYQPVANGSTVNLIELEMTAKRDIAAGDIKTLRILAVGLMPSFPALWNYTYTDPQGKLQSGKFADLGKTVKSSRLKPGSPLMAWPNDVANLVIIPLDNTQYVLDIDNLYQVWNGRERFQLRLPDREYKKGEKIKTRIVVMLYSGKVSAASDLDEIAADFKAPAEIAVEKGKLESNVYETAIRAANYAASGSLKMLRKHKMPLPFKLAGVNPNWTCAVEQGGEFKLAEPRGGILRTVFEPRDGSFALGNPLVADQAELRLEWGGRHAGGLRFFAHNPTGRTMTATVRSNPAFRHIPEGFAEIKLEAGKSGWFWMGKYGGLKENPQRQVVKSVRRTNINVVYLSNGKRITLSKGE
jgi:hypothetical protein